MQFINVSKKLVVSRLQFYSNPPTAEAALEDIEDLAVERLKVLRIIESVAQDHIKGSKEYNDQLYKQLSNCSNLGKYFTQISVNDLKVLLPDIQRDIQSHYMLILAYCKTEELSRWYMQQEIDLFKYRFNNESSSEHISKFIEENNIVAKQATEGDLLLLKKIYGQPLDNKIIYKVNVIHVLDLINQRKIFIKNNMAYLSDTEILSVLASHFRANLSHRLSVSRLCLPQLDEDDRLLPILSGLHKRYLGKDYSVPQNNNKITAEQIDSLSKKSFPPCMQKTHSMLSRDHHLKHSARMQYGLFLKGIGLPLDESLKYWQKSFQEKFDADTFAKRYAYSIRHNYGQEGKRVDYTPYSCIKIITNPPKAGECHGCPFQQSNLDLMVQVLSNTYKATPEQVKSIVIKASQKQYQVSCRNYFKVTHNLPDDYPISINHPNEYFELSRKILEQKQ